MKEFFDTSLVRDSVDFLDCITNLLQASTEYFIIGEDLNGVILWNKGARRIYADEPQETIRKMTSATLHSKDVKANLPQKMMIGTSVENCGECS